MGTLIIFEVAFLLFLLPIFGISLFNLYFSFKEKKKITDKIISILLLIVTAIPIIYLSLGLFNIYSYFQELNNKKIEENIKIKNKEIERNKIIETNKNNLIKFLENNECILMLNNNCEINNNYSTSNTFLELKNYNCNLVKEFYKTNDMTKKEYNSVKREYWSCKVK